ncbi:uncharacterized protein LOC127762533 [Oryza glaberrima]|uniref:uncharacterized protein LOC127762533 n=1 Tax=Oryza glaberrima TaxID=4538 RepID=UPI00224C06AB|nr:uncharacterized protein LOC127762533 [Oryza glaberrima]
MVADALLSPSLCILIERRLPHSFFSASAAHSAHPPSRIALPPTTVAIAPCHRRPPCPACSGIHASSVRRPTPPNPRRHFPRRHRLRPTLQLPRDAAAFSLSFVVHPIWAIPRLLAAVAAPTPHTPTPVSSTPPQRIANGAVLSLLPRDDGGAAADRKAPDVKDAASRSACSAIARSARPVSWVPMDSHFGASRPTSLTRSEQPMLLIVILNGME